MAGAVTAPTPVADRLTYPTASALRDCLAEQLAATLFGPVCRVGVRYGAAGAAAFDGCDCTCTDPAGQGAAWVRVVQVAPAPIDGRGARSGGPIRATPCRAPWLVTYELGVTRCYPVSNDGAPLPVDQVDATAQRFLSDQSAIMRAVNCCPKLDQHSGVEFVRLDALGPSGGCAGAVATIRVVQTRG